MSASIQATAIVEPGAEIGEGTAIWHHAHVMAGARVGAHAMLGNSVFVAARARVGDRTRVQNGVSLFDGVELGDEVFVGPHAVFTNVKNPRAGFDRKAEIEPTRVGRGATIGAGAVIVCGNDIGAYAFVAAGAVVTHGVAPHALVAGNPARPIGWVSRAGRRLPETRIAACPETGERYLIESGSCRLLEHDEHPPDERPVGLQDLAAETAHFRPSLRAAFERVSSSAQFVLGAEVRNLEETLAKRLGMAHTIGVSSGTDALLLALLALGIGPGDEVVTTPFSFFATASVIVRVGARPVFADIDPESFNLDPQHAERAITARTKAILLVHLFGRPADARLFELGRTLGLPVIEDAAQAIGARSARGPVGSLGALGCFSFFPTKNLGALGDGGLVTTGDDALAERVRTLRVQGAKPKYNHILNGGNFRLDALQAAFVSAKLPELDAMTARRVANARAYEQAFRAAAAEGRLRTPGLVEGHVYHHYVIGHRRRCELHEALATLGIETGVYYPAPLHLQPALAALGHSPGAFPHAEAACRESLALPVHPWLEEGQREKVIRAVLAAC